MWGLRRQEILGLKYSDIDYINRTLSVERQLGKAINTKKEDFALKTFTKQEIKLKTSSSRRELPIPDYVFNDVEYDFKPLEIFIPNPNYKVDEKELEKSIEKNKAIIARARESRKKYLQKT